MPHEEMINDSDVKGLQEFFLSGVLVGIGSLVLHFSGEAQIIISCPFRMEGEQGSRVRPWGRSLYKSFDVQVSE
jgi:hypothetical protein